MANLQPRAMCRTSTSVRPSSTVGVMPTSANKSKEIAISVVLVIVGRGDVTAGPHGTAASALRLKKAVCVPGGTVMATISTICSKQLGVTVDPKSHVTAAVNICVHTLAVLVLCILCTCRAFRHLEVFLSRCSFCQVFMCTRVCLPQGPLSLCLRSFL